jgi:hypothetical protein
MIDKLIGTELEYEERTDERGNIVRNGVAVDHDAMGEGCKSRMSACVRVVDIGRGRYERFGWL